MRRYSVPFGSVCALFDLTLPMSSLVHLRCPACSQAFVGPLQHALAVQACPHCAFAGATELFASMEVQAAAIPFQRRAVQRPALASSPHTSMSMRRGPSTPLTQPEAWQVREFPAITAAKVSGGAVPDVARAPDVRSQPTESNWQATQAYVDRRPSTPLMTQHAESVAPAEWLNAVSKPAPVRKQPPSSADIWAPLRGSSVPKLTDWPGMAVSDPYANPAPPSRSQRRLIILGGLLLVGALVALFLRRGDEHTLQVAKASSLPTPQAITPPVQAIPPAVPAREIDLKLLTSKGPAVLKAFFTGDATTRADCIVEANRYDSMIEPFFSSRSAPVQFESMRPLDAPVISLPGGEFSTLCAVKTSLPACGITRFVAAADGSLKLDWPTLRDSLEGRLASYAKAPTDEPVWMMLGLRRNSGFNESDEVTRHYLVLDIQSQGDGSDHTIVLAMKNSPTGRALESKIGWNQLYLVRVLLSWQPIEGRPRLSVLDAELLPTSGP